MANTPKIEGVSGSLGGSLEQQSHPKAKASAQVTKQQGEQIFQQVNKNLGNNSNISARGEAKGHLPNLKENISQHSNGNNGLSNPNSPKSNNGLHLGQFKHQSTTNGNQTQTNIPPNPVQSNLPNISNNQPNVNLQNQPNLVERPPLTNVQNNLINIVVKKVFQANNIHLSQNDVRRLVEGDNFSAKKSFPPEIKDLVENISVRAMNVLETVPKINGKTAHETAHKIAQQFGEQIKTVKTNLLQNADLNAKPFSQINTRERINLAIEMMPLHLTGKDAENFLKHSAHEIFQGFSLTRGLVSASEPRVELRNLTAFKPLILPAGISLKSMRDVGQLVRVLIANSLSAGNNAALDLSVQKFVRILVANNELGVLLAAVKLANQASSPGNLVGRTIALVQIYELIRRLIQTGETAIKEAVLQNSNVRPNTEKDVKFPNQISVPNETEEVNNLPTKAHSNGAELALRQFLEFNPNVALDNSVSAFYNPDDTRHAAQDFPMLYQRDIEQWLNSGNHRFVKDYHFDKPVGIVVERNNDGFFTASKLRMVLVRDGSVQGWHVLKSILVS